MTLEEKSYTDSAICDEFVQFLNTFKKDNDYKYVSIIDRVLGDDTPIELDYNDFTNEIKSIIAKYEKQRIHENLYRAIKSVLRTRFGSSVEGLEDEDRIKFKIFNLDEYDDLFARPVKQTLTPEIILNAEDDKELSSTIKVFNVGKSIIEEQVKSENDTNQVVIKVGLYNKPHWIDMFSPTFDQMVRVKAQDVYHEIFGEATYKSGIKNLHAYALLNGTMTKPVFSRSALIDDVLYYDLQNQDGDVYKVSKDNIAKILSDDVLPIFIKSPSAKTKKSVQVEPYFENPNALNEFIKLCRIQESDKIIFTAHLVSFFLKGFPIPIQVLHGEQGSAKTTVSCAIKSLVDPEGENALSLPEKIDDIAIILSKRDISNFDNIDEFKKETSQFLCRAVTGTQHIKRGLYTNDQEFSLTLMSKIILNGIDPSINQPDLLERSIFYELPKIDKTERMTDKKFEDKLELIRPSVLGIIFSIIQKAMNIIVDVEKELNGVSLPRMATFAIWGESISRALGNDDNAFLNRYWEKIEDTNLSLNEEYPLIPLILDMMKRNCTLDSDKNPIQRPKTMSLNDMFLNLIGSENKDKGLPEDVKRLAKQLRQLTPILRAMSYEMVISKYNKRNGELPRGSTVVTITPISDKGLDVFE